MEVHSKNHYTITIYLEINPKKEIKKKEKLIKNKNGSCIKLKLEVHSRNQYTLRIYFEINQKKEIEQKKKLNKNGN